MARVRSMATLLRAPDQFAPRRSGGASTPSCCGCCCCCCCLATTITAVTVLPVAATTAPATPQTPRPSRNRVVLGAILAVVGPVLAIVLAAIAAGALHDHEYLALLVLLPGLAASILGYRIAGSSWPRAIAVPLLILAVAAGFLVLEALVWGAALGNDLIIPVAVGSLVLGIGAAIGITVLLRRRARAR